MAIKYLNDGFVTLLKKDTAGAILYQVGTDEAQVITAAKDGNFAAVNAGTTAAKVTEADSAVLYRLTIDAADTATAGPILFQSKGATDTTYVWGFVVAELPGMIAASGIPVGAFVNDSITANAIATDAIGANEVAAGAVTEIVSAMLLSLIRYLRPPIMRIKLGTSTVVPCTVHTHEAKTVTVSKAGGAFGATAGSVAAQIAGTDYKLTLHVDDLDTLGYVKFLLTGAQSSEVVEVLVVEDDPTQESDATVVKVLAGIPFVGPTRRVLLDAATAAERTIYWLQSGTLPANCTVSVNDSADTSDNAPATEVGMLRSLELSATEVAALGQGFIACTTTGSGASYVALPFEVVDTEPYETQAALVEAVAAAILDVPDNLLVTDASGRVDLTTNALDSDAVATSAAAEIGNIGWHGNDRIRHQSERPPER